MPAEESSTSSQGGIKAVEIGARVLLALERGRGPLPLSAIAAESDLHPAKAHRYLLSLVRSGLATHDASTGNYDLGPAASRLGVEALRRANPVRLAQSRATELRDATEHSVYLAVWSEHGPSLASWDSGAHPLPTVVRVG